MQKSPGFSEEHLILSESVSAEARRLVQQAIDLYEDTERSESCLLRALQLAPEELDIYIAIYKYYFYKKHFNSAEHFADLTLQVAARLGGIDCEWKNLLAESCDWSKPSEPQRVFLYTMKALGFIYLRTERIDESLTILRKLEMLDQLDLVGGSVVMSLAVRLSEVDDALAA